MNDKSEEFIDISIRVGNSFDWKLVMPGKSYNFRVYRDTRIGELKSIFCDCLANDNKTIKDILERYEIFTKKIIRLYEDDYVKDAFSDPNSSIKDIIDRDENIFYALLI